MASAHFIFLFTISILFNLNFIIFSETDTIKQGQLLRDWEQLVSAGGVFRLGFFTTNPPDPFQIGSSGSRHIGIWYDRIPFYSVWVANRENPVPDSSGALTIDGNGKLKIVYQGGEPIVINSNMAAKTSPGGNFTATLLDSGNLAIRQVDSSGKSGPILWQSFDDPHNILLPGMKLGMNMKTGKNWTLTSWLSDKVPAPGAFRFGLDPSGINQLLIWRRNEIYWSSGVWQNGSFKSAPELTRQSDIIDFKFVENQEEKYFTFSVKNESDLSRWDLDTLGVVTAFTLDQTGIDSTWMFESVGPCLSDSRNSSAVCLSEKPNKCRKSSDNFVRKRGEFLTGRGPGYFLSSDFGYFDPNYNLSLSDCHAECWKNCSCVAYKPAFSDIDIGCEFWRKGANFTADDYSDFVYLLNTKN